jgi:flagellar basal-body rod protein FlgB
MPDPIFNDDGFTAARLALDGLSRRQELIGRNLANVDTPGYQAQTVNFETALKRAMNAGEKVDLAATNPLHLAPGRQVEAIRLEMRAGGSLRSDGNNVDVDVELGEMAETGIRYQAITQVVNKKFLLLRTIANSR